MKIQIVDDTSVQGSDLWLEERKKYRNASETPDVCGVGFNKPGKLKRIKAGLDKVFVNSAMKRGNDLEEQVRLWCEEKFDTMFSAQVWENGKYRASLDGLSFDHKTLVEIKVSDKTFDSITEGVVPKNYFFQVQHQLHCCPAKEGYLVAYSPKKDKYVVSEAISPCKITMMLIESSWDKFDRMDVPEDEYVTIEDFKYEKLDYRYNELKSTIDFMNSELKEVKAEMELIADGRNIEAEFTKLGHAIKKGQVDYKKILKEHSVKVDEDVYRKPSTTYSTVRIKKK